MVDFIQKQLEASERLFKVMMEDHKERMHHATVLAEMNHNLMKKLEERDATIEKLRSQLSQHLVSERI